MCSSDLSDSIVDGLAITMRIVGAKQGIIALEDNKKDLVPVLEKAISKIKANPIAADAYDIRVIGFSKTYTHVNYEFFPDEFPLKLHILFDA